VVALLVLGRAAVAPVLAFGRVQTSAVCVPAQPGGWRLEARGAAGGRGGGGVPDEAPAAGQAEVF
jgi:hypothetical protein